jgi:carbonic anhydrase/acetyltransferase-like protein (isoleucine patch superfamily)
VSEEVSAIRLTISAGARHHPLPAHRPVVPYGATPETASFIDPTVRLTRPEFITVGRHVYIAPFSRLDGSDGPIAIGEAADLQDNVTVFGAVRRSSAEQQHLAAFGLANHDGVTIGARVILAHGATVSGPAMLGDDWEGAAIFLGFNSEVNGAILERNTALGILSRVGPGVRLRSGFSVLPGQDVTTQEEADDLRLGKVRLIAGADVAFHDAVIAVNTALAREYSRLYYDDPANVAGINYNPGQTAFNPPRTLPTLAGQPVRDPAFRNRIIGDVRLTDTRAALDAALGNAIALRADEGPTFTVGQIAHMASNVTFHALEHTGIQTGHQVRYGAGVIVHGGNWAGTQATLIEDNVTIGDGAVIFRSRIGRGATIGARSAIIGSDVPPGTAVPEHTLLIDGQPAGQVAW